MKKIACLLALLLCSLLLLCSCNTAKPPVHTEPPTDPITDPITDPVTDPVTEPVTEPVKWPVYQKFSGGGCNFYYYLNKDGSVTYGHFTYREGDSTDSPFYRFDFRIEDGNLICSGAVRIDQQTLLPLEDQTPPEYNPIISQLMGFERVHGVKINAVTFTDLESVPLPLKERGILYAAASNVQNINVVGDCENYVSVDGVLYSKDMKTLVLFPAGRTGSFTIPEGVETVADGAFNYSAIEELVLPKSLKHIGDGLKHATALEIIYFPDVEKQAHIDTLSIFFSKDPAKMNPLYQQITAVYSGSDLDDDAFKHFAIANVVRELGAYENGYTVEDGVLYISEGVVSLVELDLEELSKKSFKKIVFPASMRSFSRHYMLKAEEYEVSEDNEIYFTIDGMIFGKPPKTDDFPRFVGGLVACPTEKKGEHETNQCYLVTSNAFRNSKLDRVLFGHGTVIDLPSSFRNTDVEIVVHQEVQNNVMR